MKQAPKIVNVGMILILAGCGGGEEAAPEAASEAAPAAAAPAQPEGFVDPNNAPLEQLMTVPGVDSARAAAIMAARPHADMVTVDAAVGTGVSPEQRDEIYTRLWIPIDLNTATEQEILLIPGVGEEMAEEFEEYRPYDSIERFRREIGKYVDAEELARLERYVTIR
jgi:DNA uptake protein ComE-like DNA-binding protein